MNTRTFILYLSAMLMCAAMGCAKDDAMRMEQMEAGEDGTHEGVLGSGTGSMNLTGELVDTFGGTGFAPESSIFTSSVKTNPSTVQNTSGGEEGCGSITVEGFCQGEQLQYFSVNGTIMQ
ncbi:MAG TPA: hypothetical protein EYN66_06570 [Myxococcales bacterium]|nr:hypothetical protein [Myxococcales bacterium]